MNDHRVGDDRPVRAEVSDLLDRQNAAMAARDPAAATGLFVPSPDTVLVGSEAGEIAHGPDQIAAFFTRIFARPHLYQWDWAQVLASPVGDAVVVFAHGRCGLLRETDHQWRPYRASGIAERHHQRLRWRLFHGAEPS